MPMPPAASKHHHERYFLPQQTTLGRQAVCTRRLHASSALRAADDIDGDRQRRKSAANPGATRRSPNGFHTGWRKVRYAPRGRALDSLLLPFFFFFSFFVARGCETAAQTRTPSRAQTALRRCAHANPPYLGSPDPISFLSSASLVLLLLF